MVDMKHNAIARRLSILAVAGLLVGAGCSGGSDSSEPDDTANTTTESSQPAAELAPSATTATEPPASTAAATTTTEPPAPPTASVQTAMLPADVNDGAHQIASSVAVVAGERDRAVVAGSERAADGEPWTPASFTYERGRVLITTPLPIGDAIEGQAGGIAATADTVTIVGSITAEDGTVTAAIWRSSDRGDTWTGPETPFGPETFGADVAAIGDALSVIVRTETVDGYDLLAATNASGEWLTTPVPTGGERAGVAGLVVTDDRVVMTGSVDRGDRRVGQTWTSTDGGATYALHESDVISATTWVGLPTATADGFVTAASRVEPLAPVLLRSADGVAWAPSDIPLERPDGSAVSTIDGSTTPMVEFNGLLVFGYADVSGRVAVVGADGRATVVITQRIDQDLFFSGRPFLMDDAVYSLANSHSSFGISRGSLALDEWVPAVRGSLTQGPTASSVELSSTVDGVLAVSVTYPHVERIEGGFLWRGRPQRMIAEGDGWVADTTTGLGEDIELIVSNGDRQIAIGVLPFDDQDDPAVRSGPKGGSSVAVREAGEPWQPEVPLLVGPGGDDIHDAAALGDGFVAVGKRRVSDGAGLETRSVVILETADGQTWNEVVVPLDVGERSELKHVESLPDGSAVALGSDERDGVLVPLAVGRSVDGTWAQLDLAIINPGDATVVDMTTDGEAITLLLRDGDDWSRVETVDGRSVTTLPLAFDSARSRRITNAVVVAGRLFLVGEVSTVGRMYRLALWEVDSDGLASRFDLIDAPFGFSFDVSDALVVDGKILVGGVDRGNNVVWTITLP